MKFKKTTSEILTGAVRDIAAKDTTLIVFANLVDKGYLSPWIILGFNLNKVYDGGYTALALLCSTRCKNFVERLLSMGANPNIQDVNGNTPIIFLLRNTILSTEDKLELLSDFVDYKADLNIQNNLGFAPIHIAVFFKNKELVDFLLSHGAKIDVYTKDDNISPLDIAISHRDTEMLIKLLAYKPEIKIKTISLISSSNDGCKKLYKKYIENYSKNDMSKTLHQEDVAVKVNEHESHHLSGKYEYALGFGLGVFVINPTIRMTRDWINDENKDKHILEYYTEVFSFNALSSVATSFAVSVATKILSHYVDVPENMFGMSKITPQFESEIFNGIVQSTIFEVTMLGIDAVSYVYSNMYVNDDL